MANLKTRKITKKAGKLTLPHQYSRLSVKIPSNDYVKLPASVPKPTTPKTPKTPRTPLQAPATPRTPKAPKTPRATSKTRRETPRPRNTGKSKKLFKKLPEFLKIFHRLRPGSKNKTV